MKKLVFLLTILWLQPVFALEMQALITQKCRAVVGLPVYVDDLSVVLIDMNGLTQTVARADIDSVAIYNVLENPFDSLTVTERSLPYLRELYLDEGDKPVSLVFAVRFIEDLVIFMSLDGQSHVHSQKDIDRLRPAPRKSVGTHRLKQSKRLRFQLPDSSERCPRLVADSDAQFSGDQDVPREVAQRRPPPSKRPLKAEPVRENYQASSSEGVRPTRVLADKISISELYDSFSKGYEALESFQERTYLYAKPFLYPRESRLGLVISGGREEKGVLLPIYFQWSSGEPYRFQSYTVFGSKANEFLPNAEPVFSVRSDVKSHIFHGFFTGNIMGMPAGESIFLKDGVHEDLKAQAEVQPSFNYLAMMGGDIGPYSLSAGFYFPTFGIRVGNQKREVLGSSLSYAVRAMYTTRRLRLRAIASLTDYDRSSASKDDVLVMVNDVEDTQPTSFKFNALFLRPGVDYEFTDELKLSADFILVDGNYKEVRNSVSNDIKFNRMTTQFSVQQSFGRYITLVAYLNLIRATYDPNFASENVNKKENTETRYFGALEFIF